jgi:hypothetical protein
MKKEIRKAMLLLCLIGFLLSLSVAGGEVQASDEVTFSATELLGRPTDTSITVNVVPSSVGQVYFEYGTATGVYTGQTDIFPLTSGTPAKVVIQGLVPNTQYYYRMVSSPDGLNWVDGDEHSFHTQRSPGSTFRFTITSDSHVNILLGSAATWQQTMTNIANDHPDFAIDCGDTFAMDGVTTASGADQAYLYQRQFFDIVGHSAPIFLAIGNHEQQEAWHLDDTGDPATSQPVLSLNAQKKYYLNPVPDAFYSGNTDLDPYLAGDHLLENYYAWTWGDALFVVIDPYAYTTTKPFIGNTGGGESSDAGSNNRWDWTLGLQQFNWLKQTLQNSTAKYKFIFAHHMTGGASNYGGRGGAVPANLVEWGGYNVDGVTWGWDTNRPVSQWGSKPVHQIMVDNHVTAFFHGHDHQYAYEKRDGIVYQSLAAAGFSGSGFSSYRAGTYTLKVLPSPGHLRVTVSPSQVTVDYVATTGGTVNYSYPIADNSSNHTPVADNQSITTNEDTAKAITLTANDVDGNTLTYSIVASPAHGTLSGTSPNVTYTPAANYNGSDSFTFKANDGMANSNIATVSIAVNAVNDAPVANSQSVTTNQNTAKAITLTANDVDGNTLTYSIVTSPAHGTLSGTPPNVTYTPATNYNGPDSITFKANDGTGDSNIATISITVSSQPSSTNLALNKPATADSEQTSVGNTAGKGNDGNSSTRWSANDGRLNHWWKVDLGAVYTLTGTKVRFQFARNYKYKIEVSQDNTTWTVVANRTTTTSTAQTRQDSFSATPGRYVRITYTGLPWYFGTRASHYEFEVYGN